MFMQAQKYGYGININVINDVCKDFCDSYRATSDIYCPYKKSRNEGNLCPCNSMRENGKCICGLFFVATDK